MSLEDGEVWYWPVLTGARALMDLHSEPDAGQRAILEEYRDAVAGLTEAAARALDDTEECPLRDDWRDWPAEKRQDRRYMVCPSCGAMGCHVGTD